MCKTRGKSHTSPGDEGCRAGSRSGGSFVILLAALGGFYAFIRSDLSAMENRLGERIDRNADLISENTKAIGDVREAIAHLEGYSPRPDG